MQCPRCQHENPADMKFCGECAAPLASTCPSCGAANPPENKFCGHCAASLRTTSAAKSAAPDSYTPKHLADKILTSKSALEGERKQVTVLFADLKGSMELLADRDPEEARKILDPVLEHMMEAVHRYEGTVNQVMGDGIMALFGAPLAHEDHAVRACYAALRMQESVKRYGEEVHRTAGVPLHIRVGVNSGEVVVRSIGSDLHMDYTAVGQTTHLAARLEQMSMPGSILISPGTLVLAEGFVAVKPLGERPVKGLESPIEVFEVVGAGPVRSRLQASAARGLTRFVGRNAELDQLRQALEQAATGHGQVVAVVGEPGVGKSRLFWEFTHSHRTPGWLLVESSSLSYGKATAFLPLIDLLRAYFQIDASDEARKISEKVTGKLLSLDRSLEPFLPALLWLLDVAVDDSQWQRLDPPQRRQQTLDGLKRLLLRESQVQPLLLVFEDLHWIDTETQAFLDSVVESLPTARLMLLVNYRPEYQHAWGSKTYYRQLRIDPLPPESADELLIALVGDDVGLQPLKLLLIERTEGNPFFLEESVRTLIETKVLAGVRGAYHLARTTSTLQIPATAQAILAARIDRLAPEDKRLLQAASVIGKDVPFTLLQAVAEGSEEMLRRGLTNLQAAEFLYEARLFPDLEYTFKHALTHDVAYGSLLQKRRRTLHCQIVETIERLNPDRMAEHVERLAHHAFQGELWRKAVTYLRGAGTKAFSRSAIWESVPCFERALAALQHLPETPALLEDAIDTYFDLDLALYSLGQPDRMLENLRKAESLARKLDDPRRLGRTSARMAALLSLTGKATEALPFGQSARAIAETIGDAELQLRADFLVGMVLAQAGDYRGAKDLLLKEIRSLEGTPIGESYDLIAPLAVLSRMWLVWALAELGEFDAGLAHGREALRIAEVLDHPYSLMYACSNLAYLSGIKGDLDYAVRLLERARLVSRTVNIPLLSTYVTALSGYMLALSGQVKNGILLMQEALTTAQNMGIAGYSAILLVRLGEACVVAGRREPAFVFSGGALTLARDTGQRGGEAWALHLFGEIASHPDSPDHEKADGHYRQAMALANALDMRPLVAHCHAGLAKLYRRTGHQVKAQEHLTTATTMYREMGMTYWLEKAEAEMKEFC